ncbi:MAG: Sua5/YciO/YrdC/YwlC family protein [Archangiaceae bacterium]|nr:Sua5/YciO/YrdC/YwlC family protein [Archangiaceae bacterium]
MLTAADRAAIDRTVVEGLRAGQVAILPTDTIYGLSANAFDAAAVDRLLALKRRRAYPTLVPHDVEWARARVDPRDLEAFDRARAAAGGKLTLLARRRPDVEVPPCWEGNPNVGFRFPDSAISQWAAELGAPVVSTSVNLTGERPMTSLDDVHPAVWAGVDLAVYLGPLNNPPSGLLWLDRTPWALQPRSLEPSR